MPVADMANHRAQEPNLVRQHTGGFRDGAFTFRLGKGYPLAGGEFFQSYDDGSLPGTGGAKCDHQFLADYGFLPAAGLQCVPLAIRIPLEELPAWKRRVYEGTGLLRKQTTILRDGTPSNVTMAVARLAFLEEEGLIEGWEEDPEGRLDCSGPRSTRAPLPRNRFLAASLARRPGAGAGAWRGARGGGAGAAVQWLWPGRHILRLLGNDDVTASRAG